jgi:hypothetical protein
MQTGAIEHGQSFPLQATATLFTPSVLTMAGIVYRSIESPLRSGLTWHDTWNADDRGLIQCWENGRRYAVLQPDLAAAAARGELPSLHWKGGVAGTPKMKKKYGSFFYLATWQGLRGEDLWIDLVAEAQRVCSRTRVTVTFTWDRTKLDAETEASSDAEALGA